MSKDIKARTLKATFPNKLDDLGVLKLLKLIQVLTFLHLDMGISFGG